MASVKEGVSVLMDAFKQFANKNIFECAEDGFPGSFLRCMNPQAPQSSINDDVSKSEPGRNYMQATDKLGPVSFPLMNLTRKAIPHCIFNVTYPGNSTISQESVRHDADHDVSCRI
jgi:hypothetical protein